MNTIETHRKLCLKQQTALRLAFSRPERHEQAIRLFLIQHAMLHSRNMARSGVWSFEDEVLRGLTDAHVRHTPRNGEHSIAWILWHIARCEDITMNLLVAGRPQVLLREGWLKRMKIAVRATGNAMSRVEVAAFSLRVDLVSLRGYRASVGRATRRLVKELQPMDLKRKVDPARIQQVWEEEAAAEEAAGIVRYWSRRDTAGLLLIPVTRHPLVHLNEALELKNKLS